MGEKKTDFCIYITIPISITLSCFFFCLIINVFGGAKKIQPSDNTTTKVKGKGSKIVHFEFITEYNNEIEESHDGFAELFHSLFLCFACVYAHFRVCIGQSALCGKLRQFFFANGKKKKINTSSHTCMRVPLG